MQHVANTQASRNRNPTGGPEKLIRLQRRAPKATETSIAAAARGLFKLKFKRETCPKSMLIAWRIHILWVESKSHSPTPKVRVNIIKSKCWVTQGISGHSSPSWTWLANIPCMLITSSITEWIMRWIVLLYLHSSWSMQNAQIPLKNATRGQFPIGIQFNCGTVCRATWLCLCSSNWAIFNNSAMWIYYEILQRIRMSYRDDLINL